MSGAGQSKPNFAVVGAGIGGLAVAGLLSRAGIAVRVYEQAPAFERIGAGIQMGPNAMRVLRVLGIEPMLRRFAFYPPSWANRVWDTGECLFEFPYGAESEARYGAPYLLLHRGDLHAALFSALPENAIAYAKKLVDLDRTASGVALRFADGTSAVADVVIGADGIHSKVREVLLGPERPKFTGFVAHRTVFPTALIDGVTVDTCTKWWGPDRHIVIYPVNAARSETYFVTSVPDPTWDVESWSATGDMTEVFEAMAGFHADVQRVLEACPQVHKWALFVRDPLPRWSDGPVALLGDACHPMTPYMAQGAACAVEDAAILARCIAAADGGDIGEAFRRYEATRLERASRLQLVSRQNEWGKERMDPTWVYGYDAWTAPIAEAPAAAAE
ncbi:MAG TPA: FAD-dependent monooxygenase [Xanthobacteraceae bacterium]|nr:FAD-dependent monooxygenase [Xanthobacteraceae bacterium]